MKLKHVGDCRANAERRHALEFELDLKGYSQLQMSRKLHVSPQTISLDLKYVRELEYQVKERRRLHTCEKSFAMWCQLLAQLWDEYDDDTKNHQIRHRIIPYIIEVMREIDNRFLSGSLNDPKNDYRNKLLKQVGVDANKTN
jgi:hypothetical protein